MSFKREGDKLLDTMSLDEFLIENKEATYILKVTSEAMVEAGILPGDFVIVERGRPARVGEIVITLEDGEYKIEYLGKKRVVVEAVVRAVIRKY